MKKHLSICLTFVLIFTFTSFTANAEGNSSLLENGMPIINKVKELLPDRKDISVKVDGTIIPFPDEKPFINNDNRTLVPARFVSEALGAQVDWQGGTQLVTIKKDKTRIALKVGDSHAIVNTGSSDSKVVFDTKAILKGSRVFVPLRFVSEVFLAKVDWDSASSTVSISTFKNQILPMDSNSGLTREQILRLKQYPDNVGVGIPIDINTGKPSSSYMSNEEYLKMHGLEEAKMAVTIAKGHTEAYNNVDYRMGLDEFKEKEKKYIIPQDYDSFIERSVKKINDYKIAVKGVFYTDSSLVYIDSTGTIRVRGIIRYIVYSCTDVEKIFGKGVKLNQWVEEDADMQLYSLTIGKWEYYYRRAFWISPSPRYIKGNDVYEN